MQKLLREAEGVETAVQAMLLSNRILQQFTEFYGDNAANEIGDIYKTLLTSSDADKNAIALFRCNVVAILEAKIANLHQSQLKKQGESALW